MAKKTAPVLTARDAKWTRETLPRVVLIIGPETTLREDAIAAAKKAALGSDGEDAGINWIVKHGPQNLNDPDALKPADVLDELCTASMFGNSDDVKVVLVRQADIFLKKYFAVLEDNYKNIPGTSTLILEASGYGNMKSTRFYGMLAEQRGVIDCEALAGKYGDGSELEAEVSRRALERGLVLQPTALMALMSRSAKTLAVIDEELAKLALALKPAGEAATGIKVTQEDVEEICASTATFNSFNFADAVLDRNARQSLEILGTLLDRGIADSAKPGKVITNEGAIAIMLFAALNYKLCQLQDIRAILDNGSSENEAYKAAKVPYFRVQAMAATLRKHTSASLRRCMDALFQANLNMRMGGGTNPRDVMEEMVWKIAKSN